MVRTGEDGPQGHHRAGHREGHEGRQLRRAGKEARLAFAADRAGQFRRGPRAGRQPRRRRGRRLPHRHDGPRRRPAQHRRLLAWAARQRCLDEAIAYTKERKQFGQAIADFQATQFTLADMETELQAARYLLYVAAAKVTANAPDKTKFAAMAKRLATDTGSSVVDRALQLHGGYGYLQDYPIERFWRDLRVHSILEGTNQIMRVIVSRDSPPVIDAASMTGSGRAALRILSADCSRYRRTADVIIGRQASGLNRPKAIHALTTQMCEAMSEALLELARRPGDRRRWSIDHAEGRGFCAGGDVGHAVRGAATRMHDEAKQLLLRRISAQPSAVHLSQADRRDHGRDHDGRRRRHFAAVRLPHRDREYALRHARNRHRPVPRRRRRLVSAAAARAGRRVHGADRRAARRRRMPLSRPCHPLRPQSSLAELVERIAQEPGALEAARSAPLPSRRPTRRSPRTLPAITRCFASDSARGHRRRARGRRQRLGGDRAGDARDQEPAVVQGLAAADGRGRGARQLRATK